MTPGQRSPLHRRFALSEELPANWANCARLSAACEVTVKDQATCSPWIPAAERAVCYHHLLLPPAIPWAGFAAGSPPVGHPDPTALPRRLVAELPRERIEAHIGNGLGEMVILEQARHARAPRRRRLTWS